MSEAISAIKRDLPKIEPHVILSGFVGSIAHGTYVPKDDPQAIDDKDVLGIMALPAPYYLGLKEMTHATSFVGEWDLTFYEVRKFVRLLLNANPNVLGLLWLPDNLYIHKSWGGKHLIENRDIFLTKACYNSFCGYAHSQLKKMQNHACEGYMGQKRRELVTKYGYDTKNAAHLIRLLRMGIEVLAMGEVNVFRPDAAQLKEIKRGEWTLEQVKAEADKLFNDMRSALINSKLPDRPNMEKAEQVLMEVIRFHVDLLEEEPAE